MLTPVGAEVLTRKFEEMDELNTKEDRYRLLFFLGLHCYRLILFHQLLRKVKTCMFQYNLLFIISATDSTRFSMNHSMTSLLQWMQF